MARDEAAALCHDWMLEFVCHDMWDKFKAGCDIDQGMFDLSNGVIVAQKYRNSETIKSKEVVFLMLTSTLMSLKKSLTNGSQGTLGQVDFQNIVRMVADLSTMSDSDNEDVNEKIPEVYTATVLQRILDYCRQDRYPVAKILYEEVADQLDKETNRKVQAIVHTKSKPHRFLEEYSIDDYLSIMTKYLDAVYKTFPSQPVMMKHAKYYLTKGPAYNGVRSEYWSGEIGGGEEGGGRLRSEEELALQEKLKAIRKRKLRAAVQCDENENNHSLEDEDVAADHTSESDSRSGSPRKKVAGGGERERETAETANDKTDGTHKSPRRLKHGTDGQSSTERDPQRVNSLEGDSMAEESGDEQDVDSETEEENIDRSLRTRMPLKIKPLNWRTSLSDPSSKPPNQSLKPKRRHKWTNREEGEFYQAVQRYGVGDWQLIRRHLKTDRSNVQLKDKWRNIIACNYDQLCKKYGPVGS